MRDQERPWVLRLSRVGIPLIVLLLYATAAAGFSFTPDGTFLGLQWVRGFAAGHGFQGFTTLPGAGSPSPFWVALVALGTLFRLDPLLLAKILSLFFSCILILLTYQTAHDITEDVLLSLAVALVTATSSLVLQAAPSGTPHTLFAILVLGALLSMIRQEELLASVALGLACLIAWQAALLAIPLFLGLWLSAASRHRSRKQLAASYVMTTALVSPWILYSVHAGIPWVTELPPSGLTLAGTPAGTAIVLLLAAGCGAGGVLLLGPEGRESRLGRQHALLLCCTVWLAVCAVVWDAGFALAAVPIAASYALLLARVLPARWGTGIPALVPMALLMAGFLVLNQLDSAAERRRTMARTEEAVPVITELASRVRSSLPEEATLGAEWPGLVGYVASRPVTPLSPGGQPWTDFALTAERRISGYDALFSAVDTSGRHQGAERSRYIIWKRQ